MLRYDNGILLNKKSEFLNMYENVQIMERAFKRTRLKYDDMNKQNQDTNNETQKYMHHTT